MARGWSPRIASAPATSPGQRAPGRHRGRTRPLRLAETSSRWPSTSLRRSRPVAGSSVPRARGDRPSRGPRRWGRCSHPTTARPRSARRRHGPCRWRRPRPARCRAGSRRRPRSGGPARRFGALASRARARRGANTNQRHRPRGSTRRSPRCHEARRVPAMALAAALQARLNESPETDNSRRAACLNARHTAPGERAMTMTRAPK